MVFSCGTISTVIMLTIQQKTYLFNRIFTSNEIVDVKHFRTFLRNIMYFNGINSFITAYCMHHLKYAKWETKGFSFVITSYQTIQIPFKN
jgi:hypothetical protein